MDVTFLFADIFLFHTKPNSPQKSAKSLCIIHFFPPTNNTPNGFFLSIYMLVHIPHAMMSILYRCKKVFFYLRFLQTNPLLFYAWNILRNSWYFLSGLLRTNFQNRGNFTFFEEWVKFRGLCSWFMFVGLRCWWSKSRNDCAVDHSAWTKCFATK